MLLNPAVYDPVGRSADVFLKWVSESRFPTWSSRNLETFATKWPGLKGIFSPWYNLMFCGKGKEKVKYETMDIFGNRRATISRGKFRGKSKSFREGRRRVGRCEARPGRGN